jgi:hypothetical protein
MPIPGGLKENADGAPEAGAPSAVNSMFGSHYRRRWLAPTATFGLGSRPPAAWRRP